MSEPTNPETTKTEDPQKKRKNSVFQYIAVLFAAAFVLLLFTYIMDRREAQELQQQNQEQIDDLNQQTLSAVQSLNDLYAENDDLKKKVSDLETQVSDLQSQLTHANNRAETAEATEAETLTTLEKTRIAMDWFWQLDEAYVRGRRTLAREILEKMSEDPEHPLWSYLPQESFTDTDRYSPYERFEEIRDALT